MLGAIRLWPKTMWRYHCKRKSEEGKALEEMIILSLPLPPPSSLMLYSYPIISHPPICPLSSALLHNLFISKRFLLIWLWPSPCAALLPVCVLPLCITGGRHDNITLTTNPPPKCSTRLHLICMLSQQLATFDFDNKGVHVTPAIALYPDPQLFYSLAQRDTLFIFNSCHTLFFGALQLSPFSFHFFFSQTYKAFSSWKINQKLAESFISCQIIS